MTTMPLVVVGVDGSSESTSAAAWAAREAERVGGRLRIVNTWHAHAYPTSPFFIGSVPEIVREPEHTALVNVEAARQLAADIASSLDVEVLTPGGPSAWTLLENATDARLLVIGGKRRSLLDRAVFGSVTTHAVTHAHCPVVVVRAAPSDGAAASESRGPVLLGFDDSAGARIAAEFAFEYAAGHGLDLSVVETITFVLGASSSSGHDDGQTNSEYLTEAMSGFAAKHPTVAMTTETAVGHPASVLLERAAGAELLVVGSRGRGWFEGMLLGSVSSALVHQAPASIAVVREVHA
ncbi:MAG: universal stress protein [bacterium]|nr:universal stress protein [bacterium]